MPCKNNLRMKIEKLKKELNSLIEENNLTSPQVVKISQELDEVLNQYIGYDDPSLDKPCH